MKGNYIIAILGWIMTKKKNTKDFWTYFLEIFNRKEFVI